MAVTSAVFTHLKRVVFIYNDVANDVSLICDSNDVKNFTTWGVRAFRRTMARAAYVGLESLAFAMRYAPPKMSASVIALVHRRWMIRTFRNNVRCICYKYFSKHKCNGSIPYNQTYPFALVKIEPTNRTWFVWLVDV